MKQKLFILALSVLSITYGFAQKTINVYQDCNKNSQTIEARQFGAECGHEWVDLGLSVKWATMNLGAAAPEDTGDFYAWGETTVKKEYNTWSNYKWYSSASGGYTRYTTNRQNLYAEDDAARANWGGNWRMPTADELAELNDKCGLQRTTLNGDSVVKVTSNINGNVIYLPIANSKSNGSLPCLYWSSTCWVGSAYNGYEGQSAAFAALVGTSKSVAILDKTAKSGSSLSILTASGLVAVGCGLSGSSWTQFARVYGALIRPVCK